ncbi:unnamed protein product [Blepharisma stoltei]|uniref:Uncharacterized protein n=1 Tax=Blepharisma stoltei TaxID=1481888 RepID=A0AAU9K210_9CILI|nr:unnamed protein product [Blepharisma stoltei]
MPRGQPIYKPSRKSEGSSSNSKNQSNVLRLPSENLSIVTVQATNDDFETIELRQTVLQLQEQVLHLQKDCQIYKAKAHKLRHELKKLDLYKTVCDFKTGSYLRINKREKDIKRIRSTCTSPKAIYT